MFSIRRKTSRFSESQVKELKRNGKYIPGVFVELNNSKEILRYFINGKRWKRRIINQYNSIYDNHYGEILKEANTDNAVSFHLRRFAALSEIEDVITTAYKYHENFGRRSIKFKDGFSESLPLFEITQRPYLEALGTLLSYVKAANRNYIVITGSAGNGKTNLLCSITELAIRLKESVVFLNSKNIRGSVDDYILSQLNIHKFWQKHKSVYFRILNTILRIKRKHLMVVIDAVNENDDPDYRERLHDFINMIAAYSRFKLIIAVVFILYKPVGLGRSEKVLSADDSRLDLFFANAMLRHPYQVGFDTCFTPAVLHWCKDISPASVDACEAATFSMYIDSNLYCYPCSFGIWDSPEQISLKEFSLREVWNSEFFSRYRNHNDKKCRACAFLRLCRSGCRLGLDYCLCAE